jgi:tetratricopeptide (TPR) repeat protein
VAKINAVKLKNDAAKETKAGRYDKAVELLKQVVQDNPRDWNTVNQIGFLYEKLNNLKAANDQYAKVAQFYAKDGFYLKAIACWKKVLKNDPALLDAHLSLGDLYAKQGLTAEAKSMLGVAIDECLKRGKLRDAGEALRRMAELDPSDLKVRIRLADLYAREGRQDKASEEYLTLADELVKKGHRQEALQLLEKGLKTGKRSPKLLAEVARVHLVQKDYKNALPYLEEARKGAPNDRDVALRVAEAYIGVERPGDARGILEGLLGRDPQDLEAKQLLGQLFLAIGQPDEAFGQIVPAVDRLVDRRELERAVGLLQPIAQRDPPHMPALGKLVELYRLSRNEAMVVQTYTQMVEAYLRREEMEQAASVLELLVQLEPHNEQHRSKLDWIRGQGVVPAPAESLPGGVDSAAVAASVSAAAPAAAGAPAEGAIVLSGPLSAEDQEFIDEHLSEGRVFSKYGLTDKARDQFEAALSRFPDNVEARRELVDLHKDRGEGDEAAAQLQSIAQILRLKGDEAGAQEADKSAAELGGGPAAAAPAAAAPAAEAPAAPSAVPVPEPPAPAAAPEVPLPEPPAPAASEQELDIPVHVESPPPDEPELQLLELDEEAAEPEEPARPIFDERELAAEGAELQSDFLDEQPAAPAEAEEVFDLGEPGAPPPPAGPDQTGGLVVQAAPAAGPVAGLPDDLQRVLGDVEQYVSLGFVEDAKEALGELGGRYSDHPALLGKLAELGLEVPAKLPLDAPGPPPPEIPPAAPESPPADLGEPLGDLEAPPTEPAPAQEDEPLQLDEGFLEFTPAPSTAAQTPVDLSSSDTAVPVGSDGGSGEAFDLASELGGLFGAQAAVAEEPAVEGEQQEDQGITDLGDEALTDLFREFQKGVDKQLGKEDYETRYNLGIAYKEMGLVDEAVAEFQLAAKDESRLLECASMLGICFIEKGMPKLAVKWFEKGLQAQGRSDEEYLGLRYDLASALEAAGDSARALEIFTELYGQNAKFRDVADRVRQLGARA